MNTIFEKPSGKNMKMYITNAYAKISETLWGKQEKITTYNIIIVPMKNTCEKKLRNIHYLTLTLPH
jgi:hypothetical protein